jgi:hypothetical protein
MLQLLIGNNMTLDVEYLLSHSGKLKDKQAAWDGWYRQFIPLVTNYSNNLLLVAEAAKQNGQYKKKNYVNNLCM